jgi:ribosomal protein L34E
MITAGIILALALAASSPNDKGLAHDGPLKVACVECHVHLPFNGSAPVLRNEIGQVCNTCHQRHHGTDKMRSHPVNQVTPAIKVPPDMLLDNQGRIVCITCHAFHGEYRDEDGKRTYYLRRTPGKTFCFSCHKILPGMSRRP